VAESGSVDLESNPKVMLGSRVIDARCELEWPALTDPKHLDAARRIPVCRGARAWDQGMWRRQRIVQTLTRLAEYVAGVKI
jgi:hypothetical protein